VAIQAELALTLNILENVADPALGDILDQPLHTLHHIHSQLQSCVSPGFLAIHRVGFDHLSVPCVPGLASHHTLLCPQAPGPTAAACPTGCTTSRRLWRR
jgi:hypothetical protein